MWVVCAHVQWCVLVSKNNLWEVIFLFPTCGSQAKLRLSVVVASTFLCGASLQDILKLS